MKTVHTSRALLILKERLLSQCLDNNTSTLKQQNINRIKRYIVCTLKLILILMLTLASWILYRLFSERSDGLTPIEVVEIYDPMEEKYSGYQLSDWLDPSYCAVPCTSDRPCVYKDEVDLRIIVMTFDRGGSLKKCLDSISKLDTAGDKISVEIWIDKSTNGTIDTSVDVIAHKFRHEWMDKLKKGRCCIHYHTKNAFVNGQWINTWRPKKNSKELALILEDDMSLSPYAYRWLKGVHAHLGNEPYIAGYSLQMEYLEFFAPLPEDWEVHTKMKAHSKHRIFLYPVLGTWGYAPHPAAWRKFQDWYYSARRNVFKNNNNDQKKSVTDLIAPNVIGIRPNDWYGCAKGGRESTWEMWHIKFCHDYRLFTVYSNLKEYTGRVEVQLDTNRRERGLHFSGKQAPDNTYRLLRDWKEDYVNLAAEEELVKFNYDGSQCTESCCFSATCDFSVYQRFVKRPKCQRWRLLFPFL